MRIHCIQHVPFEGPANIENWAALRCHAVTRTRLFRDEPLPELSDFEWLIVMGGPMNIYEHERYPWLVREKEFLKRAISSGKIVLGICLGAQLISDVMGGRVSRNRYREIGWFQVRLTAEGRASEIFSSLPDAFTALHWHGDAFSIPPGAVRAAESDACSNQAFVLGRAIGLQFHLESNQESMKGLLENCGDELIDGEYVQGAAELTERPGGFDEIRGLMDALLDQIEAVFGPK